MVKSNFQKLKEIIGKSISLGLDATKEAFDDLNESTSGFLDQALKDIKEFEEAIKKSKEEKKNAQKTK